MFCFHFLLIVLSFCKDKENFTLYYQRTCLNNVNSYLKYEMYCLSDDCNQTAKRPKHWTTWRAGRWCWWRVNAVRHRPLSHVVRCTSSTPRRMPWRPQPTSMAAWPSCYSRRGLWHHHQPRHLLDKNGGSIHLLLFTYCNGNAVFFDKRKGAGRSVVSETLQSVSMTEF